MVTLACVVCRVTCFELDTNNPLPGPYSRPTARALLVVLGGGAVSYERGTPVSGRGLGDHSHLPRTGQLHCAAEIRDARLERLGEKDLLCVRG